MAKKQTGPIKLDLGCGPNKKEGYLGVDVFKFVGVDVVCDLGSATWPWKDNTVEDAHASHFLEHLTNFGDKYERVHFFNELWRVLKPGGKATIQIPHWNSQRYYGDPTHKEPFSEFGLLYLSKDWRTTQAPHSDARVRKGLYRCDFTVISTHYSVRSDIAMKHGEAQQFALQNYRDAAQDFVFTIQKV